MSAHAKAESEIDLKLPNQGTANEFIPVAAPVIGEREIAYVNDAVQSGWVSSIGAYIETFKAGFADYIGVKHAIAVASGTTALHLALHALGIGPGDEVIIPDLTFAATAHTVLQTGATPVLVDVEPDTWCIDPGAIVRALSSKTRAIMPVHLFGHPADMNAISEIAAANNLLVIEDAAAAHGAEVDGRKVGSLGNVGAFSFYGNKVITTGEGGMLTTDDDALADRLRFLKDHGMSKERRYFHSELAFNYRLTNIQAALGCAQLSQIEEFIEKKRQIFGWYRDGFANMKGLQLNIQREGYRNTFCMVSAVLHDDIPLSRDELCVELKALGVDTRPFFVCMSELPHLAHLRKITANGSDHSESSRLSRRGFSLPSGCALTREQVQRVVESVKRLIGAN